MGRPDRLLLAQTSFLGDVVLTTALARAIAAARPGAELWWLVRPDAAPLLTPAHGRERVLTFDKRGADRGPRGLVRLASRLRALEFDAALGIQRSVRTALLLAAAGIPRRVGYAGSPGAWLYHRRVSRPDGHARDRLLALAAGLDLESGPAPWTPRLTVDPVADRRISEHLRRAGHPEDQPLIVVAPGSAWATKQWPAARFGEAAALLARAGRDLVVVIGTAQDRPLAAEITRTLAGVTAIDATTGSSIADAVAWISRARLVLANDSAPAHIAAALERPVVALFGPTVPAQGFAPLGRSVRIVGRELACRPCSRHGGVRCPIGTHECLRGLAAPEVAVAAQELLAERGEGTGASR